MDASPGFTLFAPMASTTTYLVDLDGSLVHAWPSAYRPALSVRLLDDGSILRPANPLGTGVANRFDAGGAGGRIERIDWDGSLRWSFDVLGDTMRAHHDAEPLPNGHVLAIAWEYMSEADAEAAGRAADRVDASGLWPEVILEIDPGVGSGAVVWEWHARDHLGPGAARIDLDAGATGPDFMHANSVDYDAELDQILLSVHGYDEVWILDHGTTTAEASGAAGGRRGHGGDLLYRWGNPASYGAGGAADQRLFGQHDAEWIAVEGGRHVIVFDNGQRRPDGSYSSVDEIALPLDVSAGTYAMTGSTFGPAELFAEVRDLDGEPFYAPNLSGAERLPNGNTLVCVGTSGTFVELTPSLETAFRYGMPAFGTTPAASLVFRASRYAPEHPAFVGRDLTPSGPIVP